MEQQGAAGAAGKGKGKGRGRGKGKGKGKGGEEQPQPEDGAAAAVAPTVAAAAGEEEESEQAVVPASTPVEKPDKEFRFWKTQPVAQFGTDHLDLNCLFLRCVNDYQQLTL